MSKRTRERSPSPPPPDSPSSADYSAENDDLPSKLSRVDTVAQQAVIVCSEKPLCRSRPFASYEEYEAHYAKTHTNRCVACGKNFPSEQFLNLHIRETHDPLSQIKFERGDKIFGCFVEGCDRMCRTPFKRRRHLIDKHHFPEDYNFFVTKDGIDRSISLLNSPRTRPKPKRDHKNRVASLPSPNTQKDMCVDRAEGSKSATSSATQTEDDATMNEISGLMTAMQFVPSSVRFGRKRS